MSGGGRVQLCALGGCNDVLIALTVVVGLVKDKTCWLSVLWVVL